MFNCNHQPLTGEVQPCRNFIDNKRNKSWCSYWHHMNSTSEDIYSRSSCNFMIHKINCRLHTSLHIACPHSSLYIYIYPNKPLTFMNRELAETNWLLLTVIKPLWFGTSDVSINRRSSINSRNSGREKHLPHSLCFDNWENNAWCTLLKNSMKMGESH